MCVGGWVGRGKGEWRIKWKGSANLRIITYKQLMVNIL